MFVIGVWTGNLRRKNRQIKVRSPNSVGRRLILFGQVDVDAITPRRYADSHWMMLWCRPVALIASISFVWLTMLKDFESSIANVTVLRGGGGGGGLFVFVEPCRYFLKKRQQG